MSDLFEVQNFIDTNTCEPLAYSLDSPSLSSIISIDQQEFLSVNVGIDESWVGTHDVQILAHFSQTDSSAIYPKTLTITLNVEGSDELAS